MSPYVSRIIEMTWRLRVRSWVRFANENSDDFADGEDAVQEAVYQTLRAKPLIGDHQRTNLYIFTTLRNLINRRRSPPQPVDELVALSRRVEDSELDKLIATEHDKEIDRMLDSLEAALVELPLELREVVELRMLREPRLTFRQIAAQQGVSITGVHYRLQRALDELRAMVDR